MSESGGSDIERLWIWITWSSIDFESIYKFAWTTLQILEWIIIQTLSDIYWIIFISWAIKDKIGRIASINVVIGVEKIEIGLEKIDVVEEILISSWFDIIIKISQILEYKLMAGFRDRWTRVSVFCRRHVRLPLLHRSRRIDQIDSVELDSYDIVHLFVTVQTFNRFKKLTTPKPHLDSIT